MNIIEAVKEAGKQVCFISRNAWNYPYKDKGNGFCSSIRLTPTNSPDGFVLESVHHPEKPKRWYPLMDDILADDWYVTNG